MIVNPMLLCYGEKDGGQWSLICLDYSLAAQAETFEDAHKKLTDMIADYVAEALGPDKEHADYLLKNRKAPLRFWLKYYLAFLMSKFHRLGSNSPHQWSVFVITHRGNPL